jgi:hypothetical protein
MVLSGYHLLLTDQPGDRVIASLQDPERLADEHGDLDRVDRDHLEPHHGLRPDLARV